MTDTSPVEFEIPKALIAALEEKLGPDITDEEWVRIIRSYLDQNPVSEENQQAYQTFLTLDASLQQ
jgi:hypothetical protein